MTDTLTLKPPPKRKKARVRKDPLESTVVDGIMTYLKSLPYVQAEKTHGNAFAKRGRPDITGAIAPTGRRFEIEVKRSEHEKPTPLQEKRLRDWKRVGVITAVVHSVDEVRAIIDAAVREQEALFNDTVDLCADMVTDNGDAFFPDTVATPEEVADGIKKTADFLRRIKK